MITDNQIHNNQDDNNKEIDQVLKFSKKYKSGNAAVKIHMRFLLLLKNQQKRNHNHN